MFSIFFNLYKVGKYWFLYKKTPNFIPAPKLLHAMVNDIQSLRFPDGTPDSLQQQVTSEALKPLQRNAFCFLGENILTSMVFDDDHHVRDLAVNKICDIKANPNLRVLKCKPWHLILDAANWWEMVNLNTLVSSVPPV